MFLVVVLSLCTLMFCALVVVSNKIIRCKQRKVMLRLKGQYCSCLVAKISPSPQVQHHCRNVDAFPDFLTVMRFGI